MGYLQYHALLMMWCISGKLQVRPIRRILLHLLAPCWMILPNCWHCIYLEEIYNFWVTRCGNV